MLGGGISRFWRRRSGRHPGLPEGQASGEPGDVPPGRAPRVPTGGQPGLLGGQRLRRLAGFEQENFSVVHPPRHPTPRSWALSARSLRIHTGTLLLIRRPPTRILLSHLLKHFWHPPLYPPVDVLPQCIHLLLRRFLCKLLPQLKPLEVGLGAEFLTHFSLPDYHANLSDSHAQLSECNEHHDLLALDHVEP